MKKKGHNIETTSFVTKMYPKNEKWLKMSSNIAIFDQKMDIYEGLSELSRPRRALRGQKFYQETSIWSSGYVPRVKK